MVCFTQRDLLPAGLRTEQVELDDNVMPIHAGVVAQLMPEA